MPEGIGSALSSAGNWASSLPSNVMNWLSPTAQAASAADAATAAGYTSPGIYAPLDSTGAATGIPSGAPPGLPAPAPAGGGDWFSGTPAAAPDSVGGLSAPGAGAPFITASSLPSTLPPTSIVPADGGTTGPMASVTGPAGAPTTAVATTPSGFGTAQDPNMPAAEGQPWWKQAIQAITGKEVGKGGGGAALSLAGNLADAIQRYMIQRRLQDPSQVLKQSQILSRGLSKGLKRDIGAATGQEMAEAGLAGAPGLYSQAVASALAPYRYQQQQDALREYLAAMGESMGAYPGSGGMYGPYGGYGGYPGEEQQQQQATPA